MKFACDEETAVLDKLVSSALQTMAGGSGTQDPLLQIIGSLLTNSGGLAGLLQRFQQAGLGEQAQSWVGRGQNVPVSVDELMQVLGAERMQQMAAGAGLDGEAFGGQLAERLPQVVDQLTPDGEIPDSGIEDALGMLAKLTPR
jgi:uncharacterized protein YidB (DUF937 family)